MQRQCIRCSCADGGCLPPRRNPPQIIPFCAEFFNSATLDDFLVLLTAVPDVFDLNFAFSQELQTSDDLLRMAGFDTGESGVPVRCLAGRWRRLAVLAAIA
jgi:hypothetical protein